MRNRASFGLLLLCTLLNAAVPGVNEQQPAPSAPLGMPPIPWPQDNPYSAAKVQLGRLLSYDGRLSLNGTVPCAFCHDPAHGFDGNVTFNSGVSGKLLGRHTPTLINRAWGKSQFWDGRAATLEAQSIIPITDPNEMGMTADGVVHVLQSVPGYLPLFTAAFGDPVINFERVTKALATFERTIVSGNSPYDRFVAGDKNALNKQQKSGLDFFNGKGECAECHSGPNFSDEKFANLGIGMDQKPPDPGPQVVTKKKKDFGRFKTPTLRNLDLRGFYMHGGQYHTVGDVLDFYSRGGLPNPNVDERLLKFFMDDRTKQDLLAFLSSLNGEMPNDLGPPVSLPK